MAKETLSELEASTKEFMQNTAQKDKDMIDPLRRTEGKLKGPNKYPIGVPGEGNQGIENKQQSKI